MLEGAPPVGKPFYVTGELFSEERTVRLYYARATGKSCPPLNQLKNGCPAGEKPGQWACQEWRRIRSKGARRFRVLIPRLRSSFSRYCFRVAFYESLGDTLTEGLVSQLFSRVRAAIHREWSPTFLSSFHISGNKQTSQSSPKQKKSRLLRYFRFLTGRSPNAAGTVLLRQIVSQEVARFLKEDLRRYTSSVKSRQSRGSLKKFLLQKTLKYGLAYLRQQTTYRRYYHLARYIILDVEIMKMISAFTQGLQKSSLDAIKTEMSRSPYIGPEKTLDGALTKKLNIVKTLNLTRLTKILQPSKQPTWSNDWARYLKQACEMIERLHIKRAGFSQYKRWKDAVLSRKTLKSVGKASKQVMELMQRSCYRWSKTKVVNLNHSFKNAQTTMPDHVSFFLRPNSSININRYIRYLQSVTLLHRSFRIFKKQLRKTAANVKSSIGGYLSSVTIRQSNLSSPLALSAKQYFFNYLSIDVGFAGALLPGFDDLQVKVFPYVGIHVYFTPVSSAIPLQVEDSFLRRFSLFVGVTLLPFDLQNNSIYAIGAMGGVSPILGLGFRVTDFIRFNVGSVLYINRSLDLVNRDEADRLAITGFVSISIDANLFELIGSAVTRSRDVAKQSSKR